MRSQNSYFLVLDIETSSLFEEIEGQQMPTATWLSYGFIKLYSIKNEVIESLYFRDWDKLKKYLNHVQLKFFNEKMYCYVQNLGYEFDYLIKNFSRPTKILSNSTRRPISCFFEGYEYIEFRCSYQISAHSLSWMGEQCGLPKLESDYRFILPSDKVTKKERKYCSRDCDVVAKYMIDFYFTKYKNIQNTPLTKTGIVRKRFNQLYTEYCNKPEWDLMPPADCYEAMVNSFSGGLVISNPLFTGYKLFKVDSYDETSAYPYAMAKEEFPYTIRREYNIFEGIENNYKFYLAKIKFKNISSKFLWGWLSISKMQEFSPLKSTWFNGKLISSEYIIRTVTNIDLELIKQTYNYDEYEILEFYPLEKYSKLPKPYIELLIECSELKSNLKEQLKNTPLDAPNRDELEAEYLLSKEKFNSIYGMTVQKLIQNEYYVDENFQWKEKEKNYEFIPNKHLKRNFLYGIYVTAYARKNLLTAILANRPELLVYTDTDSIKRIGQTEFINTNKPLDDYFMQFKSMQRLGIFEYEETMDEFITFGAKKYCYTIDGVAYTVVAGLPKKHGVTNIDDFKIGKTFKNCKNGKKYIVNNYSYELDEYYNMINKNIMSDSTTNFLIENGINTRGGICLFPTDYSLDMTTSDKIYLESIYRSVDLWVNEYSQKNGIHLIKYLDTVHPTISSSECVPTVKLMQLRKELSIE